jgi:dsDNA-specific endonuclease/ATPase MutS2
MKSHYGSIHGRPVPQEGRFRGAARRTTGADVNETKKDLTEETDTCGEESDAEVVTVLPIDGVLDLHTFSPRDVPDLLDDYFAACLEKRILDLRIIHGKGKGILRDRVRSILARHPLVQGWTETPLEAGSWGATLVRLKPNAG